MGDVRDSCKMCFPRKYWAYLSATGELLTSTIREREGDSDTNLGKLCNYRKYTTKECVKVRVLIDVCNI